MTNIRSYQDLEVWQMGMDLVEDCYRLTRGFPREEQYGLTSQIRRAAVSIPANIAEGYGRDMTGSFIQFCAWRKLQCASLRRICYCLVGLSSFPMTLWLTRWAWQSG